MCPSILTVYVVRKHRKTNHYSHIHLGIHSRSAIRWPGRDNVADVVGQRTAYWKSPELFFPYIYIYSLPFGESKNVYDIDTLEWSASRSISPFHAYQSLLVVICLLCPLAERVDGPLIRGGVWLRYASGLNVNWYACCHDERCCGVDDIDKILLKNVCDSPRGSYMMWNYVNAFCKLWW